MLIKSAQRKLAVGGLLSSLMMMHRIVHPVWVRTPLSHGLVTKMASNQVLLEPGTVAEAVVSQVLKCEGDQLILPARFNFVPFMRGWPSWLQESARSDGAQVIQGGN